MTKNSQHRTLVGREGDVIAVGALLREPDVRLVTLTGVGGVGTTRLARVLADDSSDTFPDGAVFVPLAPLHDPAHVVSAIGRALEIREEGDRPLVDAIYAELSGLEMLLVLDNFEHLMEAATVVAEILDRCPSLSMLVTSRSSLRLTGEREYPVEPSRCPPSSTCPHRLSWQTFRRSSYSSSGHGWWHQIFASLPTTPRPWPRSAPASMASRWRSSSPQPA